jgi:hypothetical protein
MIRQPRPLRRQRKAALQEQRRLRRRRLPRGTPPDLKPRWDRRALVIGGSVALLVHLFILWLGPRVGVLTLMPGDGAWSQAADPARNFDIEMAPEDFLSEPVPPSQFVEVNPDAPDNVPDETDQFGAQNQQVAQEVPDPDGDSESPATTSDTEEEITSTAIVSGNRQDPAIPVYLPEMLPEDVPPDDPDLLFTDDPLESRPAVVEARDPLSGYEDLLGEADGGIGTNIVQLPERPEPIEQRIDGSDTPRDPNAVEGPEPGPAIYFRPDPNRPLPRPQLAGAQTRPTFIANNVRGTANVGVIAHSALRTDFGDYLSRIIDTVDVQWNMDIRRKLEAGLNFPLDGSRVKVTFVLDKEGQVRIREVEGTAGLLWNRVAVEGVTARSPYGPWSDAMIRILGEEQQLTFTFFY